MLGLLLSATLLLSGCSRNQPTAFLPSQSELAQLHVPAGYQAVMVRTNTRWTIIPGCAVRLSARNESAAIYDLEPTVLASSPNNPTILAIAVSREYAKATLAAGKYGEIRVDLAELSCVAQ